VCAYISAAVLKEIERHFFAIQNRTGILLNGNQFQNDCIGDIACERPAYGQEKGAQRPVVKERVDKRLKKAGPMISRSGSQRPTATTHRGSSDNASGWSPAPSQNPLPGLLDRKLSLVFRMLILLTASLIPTGYILKHYDSQTHFTSLIFFGAFYQDRALAEIRTLKPAVDSLYGYDGQFYAQLAVDPLLTDPQLQKAIDSPSYRAQRIFLSALAHVAGFGKPSLIVDVYALLNLLFWFLLLLGLVHYLHATTARAYLCILAVVFTTGTLASLQRALTDLPAATFGFYAAALSGGTAWLMVSMAILTRQTSLLFLLRFAWPLPKDRAELVQLAMRAAFAVTPLALWLAYIYYTLGPSYQNTGALGWPFQGWAAHVHAKWKALSVAPFLFPFDHMITRIWSLFEFLAPLSLMVQVCYLAVWRSPRCPFWRMGVGFAVIFVCSTVVIFGEQIDYCRIVLPMTIAFNIGLMRQSGRAFAFNFIAGNLGLAWTFMDTLNTCIFR
jgi:hypothetical protein